MTQQSIVEQVLANFEKLCVPTVNKIQFLLKRYSHLGAYYQKARPVDSTSGISESPWGEDPYAEDAYAPYTSEPADAGIVIPAKTKAKKLIISHIDLVSTFERGFAQGITFQVKPMFDDMTYLQGGLDNGITNAFLCTLLDNNVLPDDVEILFSLGEESGLTGVTEYLSSKDADYFDGLFVINLDVSNENFGQGASSIEFDYADPDLCDKMVERIPSTAVTLDRFCDDTSAVLGFTHAAMSYCIPTDEYCHTYKSVAIIEHFDDYYEGLKALVLEMTLDYSSERAGDLQMQLQEEAAARRQSQRQQCIPPGFESMFEEWLKTAMAPKDPTMPRTK